MNNFNILHFLQCYVLRMIFFDSLRNNNCKTLALRRSMGLFTKFNTLRSPDHIPVTFGKKVNCQPLGGGKMLLNFLPRVSLNPNLISIGENKTI